MPGARDSKGRFLPKGGSGTIADDVADLGSSLGVTGTMADDLTSTLSTLSGGMGGARTASNGFLSGLRSLAESGAKALSSGLSRVTNGVDAFSQKMTGASAGAFVATAATQGLTAALGPYGQALDIVIARVMMLVNGFIALAAAAIKLTQEKDALRETFDALTGGGGDALLSGLEDLAATLPFTADKLNAWAKSLLGAGIQGEALNESIRAISAATAIMGESGGQAAMGLIKRFAMMAETGQKVKLDRRILAQLAEAGVSAKALAAALGVAPDKLGGMSIAADKLGSAMQTALINKGAKALATMGQTWSSISAKLTEGWEDAFEDLGDIVGPFMAEIQSLASEFYAGSTASGVLKDGIRGLLTPAFQAATQAVRALHIVFLQIEIAYLKAAIALHPLTSALDKLIPKGTAATVIFEGLKIAFIVAAVAAAIFAVATFIALLPLMVLIGVVGLVIYGLYRIGAAIYAQLAALSALRTHVQKTAVGVLASIMSMVLGAGAFLAQLPFMAAAAGANFVLGLVQAIMTGTGPVADAARQLASSALAALKGAFLSKSPSRAAYLIGETVPQGVTGSLEDGEGDVEEAGQGVGKAAIGGVRKGVSGKGAAGGKGSGGKTFAPVFNSCTFGGDLTQAKVFDMMAAWWEMMAASGPEAEPA